MSVLLLLLASFILATNLMFQVSSPMLYMMVDTLYSKVTLNS